MLSLCRCKEWLYYGYICVLLSSHTACNVLIAGVILLILHCCLWYVDALMDLKDREKINVALCFPLWFTDPCDKVSMYKHKPLRRIMVICNHQADSLFYVWSDLVICKHRKREYGVIHDANCPYNVSLNNNNNSNKNNKSETVAKPFCGHSSFTVLVLSWFLWYVFRFAHNQF